MKIFTKDAVYVQKIDILHLDKTMKISIPESIKIKAYGDGLIYTDSNSINSFIKYTDKDEIDFFKKDRNILNYSEVRYLSLTGIANLINSTSEELTKQYTCVGDLSEITEDMSRKEVLEKSRDIDYNVKMLEYRLKSICAFRSYKMKKLKMQFPKEEPCKPAPLIKRVCFNIKKDFMNI